MGYTETDSSVVTMNGNAVASPWCGVVWWCGAGAGAGSGSGEAAGRKSEPVIGRCRESQCGAVDGQAQGHGHLAAGSRVEQQCSAVQCSGRGKGGRETTALWGKQLHP